MIAGLDSKVWRRFWSKVVLGDGCWEWLNNKGRGGYGLIKMTQPKKRNYPAHRIAWEMENGPIPSGMCVLHSCDNPPCVRPDHLFLGTLLDNNRDMVAKGRQRYPGAPLKSHCRHGHALEGSNILYTKTRRYCATCQRKAGREYQHRKRAKAGS